MKQKILKYKYWILIAFAFLTVRIFIFITFWQASISRGGWQNFYSAAQAAPATLLGLFHDYCDWHPPLYYALSSVFLFLFHSQWTVYVLQFILSFAVLILAYKLLRLFFSEKISLITVFLLAVEPYWAWHNILLTSENLSVPLFLISLYFFFKFLMYGSNKFIFWAGIFFGLTTLTRPNSLLLALLLSGVFVLLYLLRKKMKIEFLAGFTPRKLLKSLVIFNLVFFAVLLPWMVRNQIIYGKFNISNMLYTNVYFYNIPPFLAMTQGISITQANAEVRKIADEKLGSNVSDNGDCQIFSKAELDRQFDFYQSESKKIIMANLFAYSKMHLVRAAPFFFQPGYMDMITSYGGDGSKPDISNLILRGNWAGIVKFLNEVNFSLIIYIFGISFWGLCSFAAVFSLVYSYFKDKDKFLFFLFGLIIAIYSAILVSPFVLARYRLPLYFFFFVSLVYFLSKVFSRINKKV